MTFIVLPYPSIEDSIDSLSLTDNCDNVQAMSTTLAALFGWVDLRKCSDATPFNVLAWKGHAPALTAFLRATLAHLARVYKSLEDDNLRAYIDYQIKSPMTHDLLAVHIADESEELPRWANSLESTNYIKGYLKFRSPNFYTAWPEVRPVTYPFALPSIYEAA